MNRRNIPRSFAELEELECSTPSKDRFIQARTRIDDIETDIQINSKSRLDRTEDSRGENAIFRSILEVNLNQNSQTKAKSANDLLDFEPQKFRLPELSKFQERPVPKQPFKVLDAPNLLDDFYVNVIDWSQSNNIGVGLGNSCYIWNFTTNNVQKVSEFDETNLLTGLCWDSKSDLLAVGAINGKVEIHDHHKGSLVRTFQDHVDRVGAISLFSNLLLTGSRDTTIRLTDLRCPRSSLKVYSAHSQEVCGVKWSPDGQYFASGGNDNYMHVFSPKTEFPLMKKAHKAAIRAIAWSERQYGLLATGAGTADKCIRLWNLSEAKMVDMKDTGNQVCNILFSKRDEELISSHGYSTNDVAIWKTKGLRKTHSLVGHVSRVLHLAISPCGNYVVSGAGDETLRFWNLNYALSPDTSDKKAWSLSALQINTLR
jgi:cell division cycle 20-like protein 1 (cofactor of APC complex)